MSKRPLFPKLEVTYTDSDIIYFKDVEVSTVADKIVNDIRAVKLDSEEKVNKVKEHIANILRFYKWRPTEESESFLSHTDLEDLRLSTERGMRRSVTKIYKKAKLDAAVISLHDRAVTEETKHDISRQILDEGVNRLWDSAGKELRKIDDQSKVLTSAAKSALQDCLKINSPQGRRRSSVNGQLSSGNENSTLADCDAQMQRKIAKAKHNLRENVQVLLTNPTGRKLQEEIESEEFTAAYIANFQRRVQEDLKKQKGMLDKTVKNVKDKTGKLLPFRYYNEDED